MLSKVRQNKYGKIRQDPKMLNFWASKPGFGGPGPLGHPGPTPVENNTHNTWYQSER